MTAYSDYKRMGAPLYWQDMTPGLAQVTGRRTITETDLVNFISVTGQLEEIFIDVEHTGPMGGRPVPAALSYSLIEGFQMQTLIQGTGMAMLEMAMKIKAPVHVGDTIYGIITVKQARETSKGGRGVVSFNVSVRGKNDAEVINYDVTRLIAGRP